MKRGCYGEVWVTRWLNRFSPTHGLCDLLRLSIYERAFVPTSELQGWISISVELCPMPLGMPAVRYMAPTTRFFLASLAAFMSSTVTPSSAKFWTPALAAAPSSHSRKWRLWLTAKERKEIEERGDDRTKMLIRWNAYQCQWSTTDSARRWDHFHQWSLHVFLWLSPTSCT